MEQITSKEFDSKIASGYVLVDFFATWCGPCRMLGPVLEEIANDRSTVEIVKVDIDQEEELTKKYGILSVPTLLLFKNGQLIDRKSGFMPKESLVSWIEENNN